MRWVRQAWLWLRRPGDWSAERYRTQNAMHYTALHPERWTVPERPPLARSADTR